VLLAAATPAAGYAQQGAVPTANPAVPDSLTIAKLIWSSLAALDHANRTGNYSVLRDLGAPSFQANNSAATLGTIFEALRRHRVDVSNVLVVAPTYEFPPALVQGGLLRVRGPFPLRPTAIGFDLLYQFVNGEWHLFGIAVVPIQPGQQPNQPSRR
jgi:hypothetical protein